MGFIHPNNTLLGGRQLLSKYILMGSLHGNNNLEATIYQGGIKKITN